ncbi:MAG: hypothetical protein H0T92_09815 [Pyrinomonadaceae bacterium]|nr:hypothetical protein [Pyrinomonadaceae bacterium]
MSEEPTRNLPSDGLNRILARLDSMDTRLVKMDARLEKLEARAYDTKPIWENALKEIADTRIEMREGFEKSRVDREAGLRRVERKIDILNENILDIHTDVRELEELMKLNSRQT